MTAPPTELPPLHVLFTMDCLPAGSHLAPDGPTDWLQSGRAIDGFCGMLRAAGFAATLFVTPRAAGEHQPMLDECAAVGAELALLVHPPTLPGGKRGRFLGQYPADEQRRLVDAAERGFEDELRVQPRSVRSAMWSASDQTYPILHELGFRQSSLSSPGSRLGRHGSDWVGAETDAHHVSADSRLRKGGVPLLEVPVTTDAGQRFGGVAQDLAVENGTVEAYHRPLIEVQLRRFESEGVPFRALCFRTTSRRAYYGREKMAEALKSLLDYVSSLRERYTLVPVTLAAAHAAFRRIA